jgi:hypothetical protein
MLFLLTCKEHAEFQRKERTDFQDILFPEVAMAHLWEESKVERGACHGLERPRTCGAIARLGGYLDRKSDGSPGWQTLWKGWMRVMDVLEGVHLAALLYPS